MAAALDTTTPKTMRDRVDDLLEELNGKPLTYARTIAICTKWQVQRAYVYEIYALHLRQVAEASVGKFGGETLVNLGVAKLIDVAERALDAGDFKGAIAGYRAVTSAGIQLLKLEHGITIHHTVDREADSEGRGLAALYPVADAGVLEAELVGDDDGLGDDDDDLLGGDDG